MALDSRNSALFKRAEQLRRWEESDTNREPAQPKNLDGRKIKFSSGCVFLAACSAGDKEEVIKLIEEGADINTANVDGLTALHQACIDDNLEMVEFLVQNKADVNRQDNEGWTPLHATASCGFVSIARYLIESGADLAAVNSDGDLCIDLAANNSMADVLRKNLEEQNIDCETARQSEQQMMLDDAKNWLRSDASEADRQHPRTGATALHVAAAKGYTKVLSLLLACRADVDKQDNDGWTPLHAAAHWGQKEATQMLVTSLADMDIKNFAGQSPLDVAHPDIIRFLEDLKLKNKRTKRKPIIPNRITDNNVDNHIETPPKVIRVEVKPDIKENEEEGIAFLDRISESDNTSDSENDTDSTESSHSTSISDELEEKPKPPNEPAVPVMKDKNLIEDDAPWRRSNSMRTRTQIESPPKTQVPEKDIPATDNEVILRRTQSFENDDKFYQKYRELQARIKANSCPVLPATQINVAGSGGMANNINTTNNYIVQRSASLKDYMQLRNKIQPVWPPVTTASPPTTTTPVTTAANVQIRSVNNKDGQVNSQRYGSISNLPQRSNDAVNSNSKPFNQSNQVRFGGSALNISAANEPQNRIILPRNAASISNLNMNESNGTNNTISSNAKPPQSSQSEQVAKVAPPYVQPQQPTTPQSTSNFAKYSPGNIFKNFFKSFVPPARDEESETQRKAHAKRVRETRRSTQGVTLDDFKSAEEFVKKKNMNNNNNITNNDNTTSSITSSTTQSEINERVPSTNFSDEFNPSVSATIETIPSTEPVTASYTLTTKIDSDRISDKISASYTITPNTAKSKVNQTDESKESNQIQTSITTAKVTYNVPTNNIKKETNSDDFSKTELSQKNSPQSNQLRDSENIEDIKLGQKEDPPVINRNEKRSLFEIDNAHSLSLADKLRNEANKYNEVTRSNNDISAINENENINYRKCDSTPSSPIHHISTAERRPSWRLKFDAGNKFKLEDASLQNSSAPSVNNTTEAITQNITSSVAQKRQQNNNSNSIGNTTVTSTVTVRPISAPVISTTINSDDKPKSTTTVNDTAAMRRLKAEEDKENDKENDSRSAQATQGVIQRRRRPKRRSTGVVRLDKEDLDPDRQESPVDGDEKESGSEISAASRLGSTNSITNDLRNEEDGGDSNENGEIIDYKALWEAVKIDNTKLKSQLKKKDDELYTTKAALDRFTNATTKNSLSEMEKRERRAMERKMSEMEEELKQLDALKTENQRLKDENGALIRVISKLSK